MNCDTAFDLMTNPEAARSSALARHLEQCPRCRQMQDTLAPALGLLSGSVGNEPSWESGDSLREDVSEAGRRPIVTGDALQIAEQAATGLAARFETRRERVQRHIASSLRYVAVFAAGLLLAFACFGPRDAAPAFEDRCTRGEAGRTDLVRSAGEIRKLALSCTSCHNVERHSSSERRSRSTCG